MQLKFEFSIEQINVILKCLGDQPYKLVAPVISEIERQAQPQMQPQLVPKTESETGS